VSAALLCAACLMMLALLMAIKDLIAGRRVLSSTPRTTAHEPATS
jgi:hypothetical protein